MELKRSRARIIVLACVDARCEQGCRRAIVIGLWVLICFFFRLALSLLQAKLVGRSGSREVALLIMADIVDFVELTFMINAGLGANAVAGSWTVSDLLLVCLFGVRLLFGRHISCAVPGRRCC